MIDVTPGFVLKTKDTVTQTKVFINLCGSAKIKNFAPKKKLDEEGKEVEVGCVLNHTVFRRCVSCVCGYVS